MGFLRSVLARERDHFCQQQVILNNSSSDELGHENQPIVSPQH